MRYLTWTAPWVLFVISLLALVSVVRAERQPVIVEVTLMSSLLPDADKWSIVLNVVEEDILMKTRETCREWQITEVRCVDLLKVFVEKTIEMIQKDDSLTYLMQGSSTNAILLRDYEQDDLNAAVLHIGTKRSISSDGYKEHRDPPLAVYIHSDSTNNLGDLWSVYIFIHYAKQLGMQREIDIARENTTTFVTSVGSTLQWLFNGHERHRQDAIEKPNIIHDHASSGLRTSIGNGFINQFAEEFLFESNLVDIVGVRGPLTRGMLNRELERYPPIISDPGLLASRLYPFPATHGAPEELKELGFVVHESHRTTFLKLFPEFQEHLIDNHIFLNAHAFFDQLRSYKRVVSSSLHGIIFAHTYGIPVLPVVFQDEDAEFSESVLGGDFKYVDYYRSVGNQEFSQRVPLSQATFAVSHSAGEVTRRLSEMTADYWQPHPDTLEGLRDLQQGLIIDYLELYREARDPALVHSADCPGQSSSSVPAEVNVEGGTAELAGRNRTGTLVRQLNLHQEYLLWQAVAEVYEHDNPVCPQACVEMVELHVQHEDAVNFVGDLAMKLTFPHRFVHRVRRLADTLGKSLDYTFIGNLQPGITKSERSWVFLFDFDAGHALEERKNTWGLLRERKSLVKHSLKGRSVRKHLFDYEYYNALAMANFTLCPIGEMGWSYRFLEAIMALSIPIVSSEDLQDSKHLDEGYFYYIYTPTDDTAEHQRQAETFVYRREEALRNFEQLQLHHTINDYDAQVMRDLYNCTTTMQNIAE